MSEYDKELHNQTHAQGMTGGLPPGQPGQMAQQTMQNTAGAQEKQEPEEMLFTLNGLRTFGVNAGIMTKLAELFSKADDIILELVNAAVRKKMSVRQELFNRRDAEIAKLHGDIYGLRETVGRLYRERADLLQVNVNLRDARQQLKVYCVHVFSDSGRVDYFNSIIKQVTPDSVEITVGK